MEDAAYQAAVDARIKATKKPATKPGGFVRLQRSTRRGLLLIYPVQPYDRGMQDGSHQAADIKLKPDVPLVGFAVSFPRLGDGGTVVYVVNNRYKNPDTERMEREVEDDD